jgi:hypothetical protein
MHDLQLINQGRSAPLSEIQYSLLLADRSPSVMIQSYCFLTSSAGRKRSADQTSSMAIWDTGRPLVLVPSIAAQSDRRGMR